MRASHAPRSARGPHALFMHVDEEDVLVVLYLLDALPHACMHAYVHALCLPCVSTARAAIILRMGMSFLCLLCLVPHAFHAGVAVPHAGTAYPMPQQCAMQPMPPTLLCIGCMHAGGAVPHAGTAYLMPQQCAM